MGLPASPGSAVARGGPALPVALLGAVFPLLIAAPVEQLIIALSRQPLGKLSAVRVSEILWEDPDWRDGPSCPPQKAVDVEVACNVPLSRVSVSPTRKVREDNMA